MKFKLLYGLMLGAFMFACTSTEKESDSDAPEEVPVKVIGKVTSYATDSTEMIGYLAMDVNDSSKRPGVLVVHEWWGHNEYSRQRADMLADLGYVALAVDMYGDGKQAAHPDEAGEFAGMVMGNFDEAKARFDAALETLKNHPNVDDDKIGAIGYCFGGSVVLSMANAGYDLDAVASFHGGLGLPVMPDSGAVKAKVLVANGADDQFVPEQQIEDFKAAMDAAGADYKFINYEGAVHSFTSKAADSIAAKFEMPLAYNAEADSASWEEMKALFAEAFK
ncbi:MULTISPECIES: dienelactone hydrolase family protein [unclassified Ekhidna]|jgi:dienelactone hydrolase|uniref:dienelactone hydrolase family protein n=1 Tax=unclassified Ekhidna TaxID=2632188 RepID=UPI0032DEE9D1